jgi:hypothetical protein
MVNHSKQVAVDMTAEPDEHEASAVIEDLVAADAMQWDVSVDGLEVSESTGWLGHSLGPCGVNGWNTMRFDVRGSVGVTVQKKGYKTHGATFEEYFGRPLPPDACLPELQEDFRKGFAVAGLHRIPGVEELDEITDIAGLLSKQAIVEDLADIDCFSDSSEVLAQWPQPSPATLENNDSRDCDAVDPGPRAGSAFPMSRNSERVGLLECPLTTNERTAGSLPVAPRTQTSATTCASSRGGNIGGRAHDTTKRKECDQVGKSCRNISASVWLTTDFAIPLQQFLPVLEAFSSEHEAMRRLHALLGSQSVKDAAERARVRCSPSDVASTAGGCDNDTRNGCGGHVFPVKVSVPVNLAVRALAHFESFELRPPGSLSSSLFEVPASYRWVHRRGAQKTLDRRTKRAFLAHLVSA